MKRGPLRQWAAALTSNIYALYLASRDPRVPVLAKLVITLIVAYALSPIDLIPDFIPIIGFLDDLVLLPIGIWLAIKLIPQSVWKECQDLAVEQTKELPRNRQAATVIITLWILLIVAFLFWVWPSETELISH